MSLLPEHTQYRLLSAEQALLQVVSSHRRGVSSEALAGIANGSFRVLSRR